MKKLRRKTRLNARLSGLFPPTEKAQLHLAAASADAGFALVDTLVALMILASTLALSLAAMNQADRVSKTALENRQAQTLLSFLADTQPTELDQDITGATNGFSWRVETRATGADRPIAICRRAVVIKNDLSGRTYRAATLESCPSNSAA